MRTATRAVVTVGAIAVVLAAAAMTGLLADLEARDTAFVVDRFDRVVAVRADGTAAVEETVAVTFSARRRGIFRDLPIAGPIGATYLVHDVEREDGTPWPWTEEHLPAEGLVRIRVGDPSVWLEPGRYTYRFRYDMRGLAYLPADRPGRAEVRIDVPGFDWPTDIAATNLTVVLPGAADEVACVAGPRRTVRPCDPPATTAGSTVTGAFDRFGPGRAATVAIDLDAGAFTPDLARATVDPLTSRPGLLPVIDLPAWQGGLVLAALLLVPFGAVEATKSALVYRDERTDPHLHDRVHPTATFAPPHGHRPVEVAGLLLRASQARPLLMGTLIDLDQRGALHASLEEAAVPAAAKPGRRRRAKAEDGHSNLVVRPGPPGVETASPDREFVAALLPDGQPLTFDGKYDRDTARRTSQANAVLLRQARGVFDRNGYEHDRVRWLRDPGPKALLLLALLALLWAAGRAAATVFALPQAAAYVVAAIVLLAWVGVRALWSHHRLPLNSQGRDAVAQARSFREFLATVQRDQLEWAAGQRGIDHHHPAVSLLPYAVVLGLADSWYERFGPLLAELTAAAGGAAAGGTTWWASSRGYDTARTTSTTTTTSPSSGGSSGGGGSGGGGGGGGSW